MHSRRIYKDKYTYNYIYNCTKVPIRRIVILL